MPAGCSSPAEPVRLDLPEVAALMASLAALSPTASTSAESAMRKLAAALGPEAQRQGDVTAR